MGMIISNASVCRISVSCFVPIPTTITFGAGDEERWLRVDSRRVREDSSSLDRRHSGAGLGVGCQSGSCHQAQANKKDRLIRGEGRPSAPNEPVSSWPPGLPNRASCPSGTGLGRGFRRRSRCPRAGGPARGRHRSRRGRAQPAPPRATQPRPSARRASWQRPS